MMELFFEFLLDLILFRWVYGDGDDHKPWWVYLIALLALIALIGVVWWIATR